MLVTTSAFLSGSEVSIFSLSRYQLKSIRERFRGAHRIIKKLLSDPSGVLMTILICNELVNISLTTLITDAVTDQKENPWRIALQTDFFPFIPSWAFDLFFSILITTPIILIFCEITPKALGARINSISAPLIAKPLFSLYTLLSPIRISAHAIATLFFKLKANPNSKKPTSKSMLREEDFLTIAEEAQREGEIQETELSLIRNVFELDDTTALEIMTPIQKVFSISHQTSLDKAQASVREGVGGLRYSRIPVTGKSKTDIVGILYSKDLLVARLEKEDPQTPISRLMWKPYFVPAATRLNTVFRKMKRQRTHMAIITNELDEAIGIVTMNDVLEALLDELLVEEDSFKPYVRRDR